MNYSELYNSLNQQQKKAVDKVEGTLMVIAGPGTGKTQVLGARVASILEKTDCAAENILCLTFTEAATVALRNRLFSFIDSDAHRVNIFTYHAFCNMVIQDHVPLFGFQDLTPASDLDVLQLIKEIIDELPKDHSLKRYKGAVYYDSKELIRLFNLMKKDRLTLESISSSVNEYLEVIADDPNFRLKRDSKYGKKGDLKREYYLELERMEKLKDAAGLLKVYQEKMADRRLYDYNDMITWVVDSFTSNEDLLREYQEKYQYILVDEYQDTNGAQNALLQQLIDYWDNPNVFVVGDDDQSIYKFQGANVENIHQFYKRYEQYAELVVLTENYRSTPSILKCSNSLISHNKERLVGMLEGLNKNIIASNHEIIPHDKDVLLTIYPNIYQEIVGVASKIQELQSKGVKLNDIAVLYRNHHQSSDLIKYLQHKGIPFEVAQSQNILEEIIVIQLLNVLSYLDLEETALNNGQHLLFEILHANQFIHLTSLELAQLSHTINRDYNRSWRESLKQICDEEEKPSFLSSDSFKELKQFISDLEFWQKEKYNVSLQTLVEHIMAKGGFISRALSSYQNIYEVQCLKTLFNFLKDETAKDPLMSIEQFLAKIELLKMNDLGIELNKVVYGNNGVQLMTAHGSKGLEFGHVFMIGCTADKWEKNSIKLAFNLDRIIEGEPESAHMEEGRRLFYVGITRAKKSLYVSYSETNEKNKPLSKSTYVDELEKSEGVFKTHDQLDDLKVIEFFTQTIDAVNREYLSMTKMDFVDRELDNFRMSATNLNSYLKCPVAFFYQNIVRVPSAKNENMTFGSSVHGALEKYFIKRQENNNIFPEPNILAELFLLELNRHKESFTKESFARKKEYGVKILNDYANFKMAEWLKEEKVEMEVSIKNVEFNGIPIRGQLDKLVETDNGYYVVDYKTGQYKYAKLKINPPVDKTKLKEGENDHNKIYGGDYWRQIMFYFILMRADQKFNKKMLYGVLEFLEPENNSFMKETIVVSKEELDIVEQQIKMVYQKIKNKEFDHGCNKDDCEWCNFNRYYMNKKRYLSDGLLATALEEMDER